MEVQRSADLINSAIKRRRTKKKIFSLVPSSVRIRWPGYNGGYQKPDAYATPKSKKGWRRPVIRLGCKRTASIVRLYRRFRVRILFRIYGLAILKRLKSLYARALEELIEATPELEGVNRSTFLNAQFATLSF